MSYRNMVENLRGKRDQNGQPRRFLADLICDILEEGTAGPEDPDGQKEIRDILYHALSFLYPGEREARITELLHTCDSSVQLASEVVDMFHCIANSSGDVHKTTSASAMFYISQQGKASLWALWAILEAYADQPMWMYPTKTHYTGLFKHCAGYTAYLTAVRTYLNIRHPEADPQSTIMDTQGQTAQPAAVSRPTDQRYIP